MNFRADLSVNSDEGDGPSRPILQYGVGVFFSVSSEIWSSPIACAVPPPCRRLLPSCVLRMRLWVRAYESDGAIPRMYTVFFVA